MQQIPRQSCEREHYRRSHNWSDDDDCSKDRRSILDMADLIQSQSVQESKDQEGKGEDANTGESRTHGR
jgi:hypothetical protein